MEAVKQEKAWAEYLFKDGSTIGLNAELLSKYVDWIAPKESQAAGLPVPIKIDPNEPSSDTKMDCWFRCTSSTPRNRNFQLCNWWY